jgi:hypothetical protein
MLASNLKVLLKFCKKGVNKPHDELVFKIDLDVAVIRRLAAMMVATILARHFRKRS